MRIDDLLVNSIDPAFHLLSTKGVKDSEEAYVLTLAIGYQESGFVNRLQINGPARSYWQFEKGGGVWRVLYSAATKEIMAFVCHFYDITPLDTPVFEAIAWHDQLAAAAARLNLWSDPAKLPAVGDVNTAWDYYIRVWAPGAPRRTDWDANYVKAVKAIS